MKPLAKMLKPPKNEHWTGQYDLDQLAKGIDVELEHTDDPGTAFIIATQHLDEHPRYYDALHEMERSLSSPLYRHRHILYAGASVVAALAIYRQIQKMNQAQQKMLPTEATK